MKAEVYLLDICQTADEHWKTISSMLPEERKIRSLKYQDKEMQKQSMGAGLLLSWVLRKKKLESSQVEYTKEGKPFLHDNPVYISLSHTAGYAACAVSNTGVGIDIQDMSEGNMNIMKRFYTTEEKEYITQAVTQKEKEKRFYEIWCRKEAFIKVFGYQELQLIDTLRNFEEYKYHDFLVSDNVVGCLLTEAEVEEAKIQFIDAEEILDDW